MCFTGEPSVLPLPPMAALPRSLTVDRRRICAPINTLSSAKAVWPASPREGPARSLRAAWRAALGRGLVGAVTVERVGFAALVRDSRCFVEQVSVGERGGLQFSIGLAEAEPLHGFAGAVVRTRAVGDLGFLLYPSAARVTDRPGRDRTRIEHDCQWLATCAGAGAEASERSCGRWWHGAPLGL